MVLQLSLEGLEDFADEFWKYVKGFKIFAFYGPMGVGKTTIITALCRAKGVKETIGSPTFSIINEYNYRENKIEGIIYHIDLYRLNSKEEIVQAGVEDCVYSGSLCFIEWPQKASYLFDEKVVKVEVEQKNESERAVKINRNL